MNRVRLEDLRKAIRKVLEENNMDTSQAKDMADRVMSLFGFDKAITDNLLSSDERDIFYMLEDFDILATEEETTSLPSGKNWRIHYWRLKEEKIREILKEKEEEEKDESESIYDDISDNVWKQHSVEE
ncbi:MAG: DUF6015 family protein [Thermoplasmatota archaeon]